MSVSNPFANELYRRGASMKYDFDEIVDRKNTRSFKYDHASEYFGTDDLIPMWVADMDFRTPDFVMEARSGRMFLTSAMSSGLIEIFMALLSPANFSAWRMVWPIISPLVFISSLMIFNTSSRFLSRKISISPSRYRKPHCRVL